MTCSIGIEVSELAASSFSRFHYIHTVSPQSNMAGFDVGVWMGGGDKMDPTSTVSCSWLPEITAI